MIRVKQVISTRIAGTSDNAVAISTQLSVDVGLDVPPAPGNWIEISAGDDAGMVEASLATAGVVDLFVAATSPKAGQAGMAMAAQRATTAIAVALPNA
jgi:hypothetical protein